MRLASCVQSLPAGQYGRGGRDGRTFRRCFTVLCSDGTGNRNCDLREREGYEKKPRKRYKDHGAPAHIRQPGEGKPFS